MEWPQWIVIVLHTFALGVSAASHGQPRPPMNFWASLIGTVMSLWLLWMGGFFSA